MTDNLTPEVREQLEPDERELYDRLVEILNSHEKYIRGDNERRLIVSSLESLARFRVAMKRIDHNIERVEKAVTVGNTISAKETIYIIKIDIAACLADAEENTGPGGHHNGSDN